MKRLLLILMVVLFLGCPAPVDYNGYPSISGVMEKVEWLEDGSGYFVIKFEDGRSIKLFHPYQRAPLVFQYGKKHTFYYQKNGILVKMEVEDGE
jgi:hypothetical protein